MPLTQPHMADIKPNRHTPPPLISPTPSTHPLNPAQEPAPISEADLPLTLPDMDDFKPSGTPDPPLAKAAAWVAATDPATGERSGTLECLPALLWVLPCLFVVLLLPEPCTFHAVVARAAALIQR